MPIEHRAPWNASIVALLASVFCATAAALIATTALGKLLYDLTRRELDLGLLGLAEFAPSALLVLVTGAVADRFDRARVSTVSALVQALAGVGLAIYVATHPTSALPIFALVVVFGAGRAFMAPSNRALPADIVPADRLPSLTARRAATWQSAIIVGPVIGGFLYVVSPVAPFIAMAILLTVAAATMFFVVAREGEPAPRRDPLAVRGGLHEAFEGLRFIRRSPLLLGAISLDLFAVLFGGAVALLPAIAEDRLGVGAVGLGWLRAAGGIGAAATTLFLARWPVTRRVGRRLLMAVCVFGLFTVLLGATRVFAVAFLAMAVLSGADAISVYVRSTLVPLATPPDRRGRVIAVESVFIGASNELGAFESGVAGQVLGASGAIVLGGAATLVVAATYWFVFPVLRRVDRFPRHTDAAGPVERT